MKNSINLLVKAATILVPALAFQNAAQAAPSVLSTWPTDPVTSPLTVATHAQTPHMATTSDGYTYVAYVGGSKGDLFLTLLNPAGRPVWQRKKVVTRDQSYWSDYGIATDSEGNAIIGIGTGTASPSYALVYKIDRDGTPGWSAPVNLNGGQTLPLSGQNMQVKMSGDVAIVTWAQEDAVTGQLESGLARINADGAVAWNKLLSGSYQVYLAGMAVDSTSIVAAFENGAAGTTYDQYYAQKYSLTDGSAQWTGYVQLTTQAHRETLNRAISVAGDANGGMAVTWLYTQSSAYGYATLQHVNADGSLSFAAPGIVYTDLTTYVVPSMPQLICNASGYYMAWTANDGLGEPTSVLYGRAIDPAGHDLWTGGMAVIAAPKQMNVGNGGTFLNYDDARMIDNGQGISVEYSEQSLTDTFQLFGMTVPTAGPAAATVAVPLDATTSDLEAYPDVIASPSGDMRVAWINNSLSAGDLDLASLMANGTAGSATEASSPR